METASSALAHVKGVVILECTISGEGRIEVVRLLRR
jgi:hypothetical protein